jgi:2-oxoglutarate ferredoxin oxidoreductase subunit beta
MPTPIGVFRDVERPVYDVEVTNQIDDAVQRSGFGDLRQLIHSGATWTVA